MTIFAVSLRYTEGSEEQRSELIQAHRDWVAARASAGQIVEAGPLAEIPAALFITKFATAEELTAEFDRDPFWVAGLVQARSVDVWIPRWGPFASPAES